MIFLHHVALQTADLDRAVGFYTRILGAELISRRPFKRREMAWLRIGAAGQASIKLELFSVRQGETVDAWSDRAAGPVHLAFAVPDVDAFLATALAAGATFHPSHPAPFVPPVAGAGKMAYLLGPDGEELEIRAATDD